MVYYKYAGKLGIKIIQDLRLKVTPPNEFNDPFEATPRSRFTLTLSDMVNRAKTDPNYYRGVFDALKKNGQTFENFIAELTKMLPVQFMRFAPAMREELVKRDMKSINDVSEYFGLLCVSKTAKSIPMWSHYADSHRGIVIGLNLQNIGRAFGPFREVKYHTFRKTMNPWQPLTSSEGFRNRLDLFFVKSKDWIYEQEYRRMFQLKKTIRGRPNKNGKSHSFVAIKRSDILEIIFGCGIKSTLEKQVRAELNRHPNAFRHVKLFRCKRHDTEFELELIKT